MQSLTPCPKMSQKPLRELTHESLMNDMTGRVKDTKQREAIATLLKCYKLLGYTPQKSLDELIKALQGN